MGSESFVMRAEGKSMSDAFSNAHDRATYDHGHAGYSGTIAEKPGAIDCGALPDDVDPGDLFYGDEVRSRFNARVLEAVDNKWDECAGFTVKPGHYVFIGHASS